MRQQKQQQLSNFDEVFIQAVNNKTNLKFVTIQDAHQEFINRQNGVVFDIWKDMAVILNISAKKSMIIIIIHGVNSFMMVLKGLRPKYWNQLPKWIRMFKLRKMFKILLKL
ncbi:Hypothetical_protein [Hexamita inflata]|uniref:Hypothetical_protein n=1 Tax=Hexamita inflata TaxID=28002 RepID=A0ABP1IAQ6_9EUKA